jgi:hypothetical protein
MAEYDEALARYRRDGASKADDAALMAAFCEHDLQLLVGAVSPKLVWSGAQKHGLTALQLTKMTTGPMAVSDLQWL